MIPAHNEAGAIRQTVEKLAEVLDEKNLEYRITVTEDGSDDGTREILEEMQEEGKIEAVTSEERQGYTGALKQVLEGLEAEYVLFIDGDGQYFARDFPDIWERRADADIVSGKRRNRADSFLRRFYSNTFQFIVKKTLEYPEVDDMTSSFRLVRSEVVKQVFPEVSYMEESFWTEFNARAHSKGYTQSQVPVRHRKRGGEGDTRIYHLSSLPGIALRQLIGLKKLRSELESRS